MDRPTSMGVMCYRVLGSMGWTEMVVPASVMLFEWHVLRVTCYKERRAQPATQN